MGTGPPSPAPIKTGGLAMPTGGKIGSASASSGSRMPILTFVTLGTTQDVAPTDD